MTAFILALLAAAAAPDSAAAIRLYDDACAKGSFRLKSGEGAVVKQKEIPAGVPGLSYRTGHVVSETYVRMNVPSSTYLIFRQHNAPSVGLPITSCGVISRSIHMADARQALIANSVDPHVLQSYDHGTYLPEWSVDMPEIGVRKSLRLQPPDWVIMRTEVYRTSSSPNTDKKPL